MTMSKSDFIATVLENVGVLAGGQTASAEDRALVERRMSSVFAQLDGEDIYSVADEENLDDAVALPLADIVARQVAPSFGIVGEQLAGLELGARAARDTIKLVTRERKHRDTLRTPWFWGSRAGGYDGTG